MTTKKSLVVHPRTRFLRTFLQVLSSVLLTLPAALALLPNSAESAHVIWAIAISNIGVLMLSAIQNAIESARNLALKPGEKWVKEGGQSAVWLLIVVFLMILLILIATGRL